MATSENNEGPEDQVQQRRLQEFTKGAARTCLAMLAKQKPLPADDPRKPKMDAYIQALQKAVETGVFEPPDGLG